MHLATLTRGLLAGLSLALLPWQAANAQNYGGQRYDDDDTYYDDRGYDDRGYDTNRGYGDDRYDSGSRRIETDERYYDDEEYGDQGGDAQDVSFFYDELRDHGRWISHRDYGYVWTPANVDSEWRPYSRGYWVNTDEHGWYWVSEESFGWATYHYGRWFQDDRYGWLWVPGTTWGPAWVAWRYSDSYVGWAPLPPSASWDRRAGLTYSAGLFDEPRFASYWSFIEPRYISTPGLYRYTVPRHRARTLIYSTRAETRYDWRRDNVFNVGISIGYFNRHLDRPLTSVRVYATDTRHARGYDRRAGDTVRVWRPDIKRRKHAVRHDARPPTPGFWANIDRRGTWQDKRREGTRPIGLPPSGRAPKPPVDIKRVPRDTYTPPRNVRVTPPIDDRVPSRRDPDRRPRDRDQWDDSDPRAGAPPPNRPASKPEKHKGIPRDNPRYGREVPPDRPAARPDRDERPRRENPRAEREPPADRPVARPDRDERPPRDIPRAERGPKGNRDGERTPPPRNIDQPPPPRTAETPPPKGKERDEPPPPAAEKAPPAAKPAPRPIIIPGRP